MFMSVSQKERLIYIETRQCNEILDFHINLWEYRTLSKLESTSFTCRALL